MSRWSNSSGRQAPPKKTLKDYLFAPEPSPSLHYTATIKVSTTLHPLHLLRHFPPTERMYHSFCITPFLGVVGDVRFSFITRLRQ